MERKVRQVQAQHAHLLETSNLCARESGEHDRMSIVLWAKMRGKR
jgi:hypothetical protein